MNSFYWQLISQISLGIGLVLLLVAVIIAIRFRVISNLVSELTSKGVTAEKGLQTPSVSMSMRASDEFFAGDNSDDNKDGDIITVDVGACYKGYHGDSGWTYTVGNVTDPKVLKLLEVTEKALYIGLEQVKPGNHVGDVSNAIQTYVESFGFGLPADYTGHGIGRSVHEDPYVPNVGKPGTMALLKKGMCIAVEPMVFMGSPKCYTLPDGWGVKSYDHSWAAHYEHTVAITDDGYRILTKED